jgi:hypothetical protein
LPEDFDNEYFRHMQWAHFASGGAGGGMRWPNRDPHTLTDGMRAAQKGLANFLPLIDWTRFDRRNCSGAIHSSARYITCFGCADSAQAVIWLLRTDSIGPDGRLRRDVEPINTRIDVPALGRGRYHVTFWDTGAGRIRGQLEVENASAGNLSLFAGVITDTAIAILKE